MDHRNQKLKRLTGLAAALALAGCGANDTPITATTFDGMTQEARVEACNAAREEFIHLGVWRRGAAMPWVSKPAWDLLSDAERERLIATAACFATGFGPGERIVTIEEDGGLRDLATRRVVISP